MRSPHTDPALWKMTLAFASVYFIWGSTYLAIRFAIETLPLFSMAVVRFLVAGAILYTFARRWAERPDGRHWLSAAIRVRSCLGAETGEWCGLRNGCLPDWLP